MPSKYQIFVSICLTSILFTNSFSAEQLYTKQPSVTPELANMGKWSSGVTTVSITNPEQLNATDFITTADRKLTLEIWYPASIGKKNTLAVYQDQIRSGEQFELLGSAYRNADIAKGKFPLVVLSHGYTGYRTIMFYLGEHLASHGYIVASIDHTDSTNVEIDFEKNSWAGFPSTILNRARDQQFVLDYFSNNSHVLSKHIDTSNAAVIGYSMGGYGALNTVGSCYSFNVGSLTTLGWPGEQAEALLPILNSCNAGRKAVDSRWKAMIAIAPWGGELNVHSSEALAQINVPTLFIAGEDDDVSGYEQGVRKLFQQTSPADNYIMVYENARHNIAPHPAPEVAYGNDLGIGHYYEPSWEIETINRINQHISLAFLDCYVKGKSDRCDYLPNTNDNTQTRQTNGKMSPAWPGFKERWGSGVRFYHGDSILK